MIIEKYGIRLKRIAKDDIELIREKRNSYAISSKMVYQKRITSSEQVNWFESVDNFCNFYYLIIFNNEKIGLINDKNVDWVSRTSEAGLFIWETKYLNTIVPSLASLCLLEMGFEILNWNETSIEALKSNKEAIVFNRQIGFLQKNDENCDVISFKLDKTNYNNKARKLILSMTKLNDDKKLKLFLSKEDFTLGIADQIEKVICQAERNVKQLFVDNGKAYEYSIL